MNKLIYIFLFIFFGAFSGIAFSGDFNDVAKILKNRCVECHRPGEVAPMSFDSYDNIRPWAKSILKNIELHNMPPWFANKEHGSFSNENTPTKEEVKIIKNWVESGAPRGEISFNMLDGFLEGWQIGTPNVVFEMPIDFEVPENGIIDYKYFKVSTNFTEDKWISALEARPGNRNVVHHIIVFVVPHDNRISLSGFAGTKGMIGGYAPGLRPNNFIGQEVGLKIPANSDIIFQMHYTPNGKKTTDRSKIGMIFCDKIPRYKYETDAIPNLSFRIPPGDSNYYAKSSRKFIEDTQIVSLMPHMHLRGKYFKYTLIRNDGSKEILLCVDKYNFDWQISYFLTNPLYVRQGDEIICEALFDNSSNNPNNPDPTKEVRWGDQTFDEMLIGWFSKIKVNADFEKGNEYSQQSFKIDALMAEQRGLLKNIKQEYK